MGPLAGIKIVEIAGIGPSPMCAMLLADLGATVLRIERPNVEDLGIERPRQFDLVMRGRHTIKLDLKSDGGKAVAFRLIEQADAVIEGFRPGVMERLGLGPEHCLQKNPRLIYGRMTGWGQSGPLAQAAGHDINYIALVGVLHSIGRADAAPAIPLNLIGDLGGGALYLAVGILAALLEAKHSGAGQVVDAAMVDGAASLMMPYFGLLAAGMWDERRGTNFADGAAPYYDSYLCADGKRLAVGPIEQRFFRELLQRLDLDAESLPDRNKKENWPAIKKRLAARFADKPREHWCRLLEGTDACVAPVLTMSEAPEHPHLRERGTFLKVNNVLQPAPAPRFSRTIPHIPAPPRAADPARTVEALEGWLPRKDVEGLVAEGVFGQVLVAGC